MHMLEDCPNCRMVAERVGRMIQDGRFYLSYQCDECGCRFAIKNITKPPSEYEYIIIQEGQEQV